MTNTQLIRKAEDAMRFLRECGSSNGAGQAEAIGIVVKRLRCYEAKLVQFNASTREMLEEAGLGEKT